MSMRRRSRARSRRSRIGPVASQIAIKMLGTNGGGFFNANAAHPFENPTPLSNFIQMVSIFAIGAALTNVFGRMVGDERQGWAILAAMGVLFIVGVRRRLLGRGRAATRLLTPLGARLAATWRARRSASASPRRLSSPSSPPPPPAVRSTPCTTRFMPLGGMIPLINMELGEIIVGGVGAGLYGMLLFVILTMFVAGLMVGRTPEYLGKKIEAKEVKMAMLAILFLPLAMLGLTADRASCSRPPSPRSPTPGRMASREVLYAYTSGPRTTAPPLAG